MLLHCACVSHPHDVLHMQVLSRGSIVVAGSVDAGGARSKMFSLPVQPAMAPNARIVVYYVRADGEIVTDSISFDVDGAFQNQASPLVCVGRVMLREG